MIHMGPFSLRLFYGPLILSRKVSSVLCNKETQGIQSQARVMEIDSLGASTAQFCLHSECLLNCETSGFYSDIRGKDITPLLFDSYPHVPSFQVRMFSQKINKN